MRPDYASPDPGDPTLVTLRVVRTPPTGLIRAWVTSDSPVSIQTHWHQGRTQPHMVPTCQACDAGTPTRWHMYIALWLPATTQHVIWQGTLDTFGQCEAYRSSHGTCRGALASIKRAGKTSRSMVLLTLSNGQPPPTDLPPAPKLTYTLEKLWGLTPRTAQPIPHDPWHTSSPLE